MILDGVYYHVIHFCRVILYVWCSPLVFSQSPDECLVTSTSTFVSGRISTSSVSSPDAPLSNQYGPYIICSRLLTFSLAKVY